jgi:hypothetical protein
MRPVTKASAVLALATRYVLLAITLIIFVVTVPACKKQEFRSKSKDQLSLNVQKGMVGDTSTGEGQPGASSGTAAPQKRKVIVTQDLTLEVRNLAAAFKAAIDLTRASNGYTTETSRVRNDNGSYLGRVVMRVPPGKMAGLLEKLRVLGTVTSENSTGEDITDEYVDLEARLKTLKASEARLLELLQRRTQKLADVLAVEKELTRVRGDIEAYEAKRRNWDVLTNLVTVCVELVEPRGALPVLFKVWNPIRTSFGEALENLAESLHALIVFIGMILPWTLFAGVPLYLYFRFRRKGRTATKLMDR